jgi:hypothetical protein
MEGASNRRTLMKSFIAGIFSHACHKTVEKVGEKGFNL